MNTSTRALLVLLRLAIGWHLLFAGAVKFRADYPGSEGYLREASGPLAPAFHWLAGDRLVDRCTPQPLAPGPDQQPFKDRLPKALNGEWEAYYQRFVQHYGLDEEQQTAARGKFDAHKEATAEWLIQGSKEVKRASPHGPPFEVTRTTPERLQDYVEKRDQVRAYQRGEFARSLGTLFAAATNKELAAERAALARLRNDLTGDLDARTADMKESLRDVLTREQAEKGPVPGPVRPGWLDMTRLDWVDFQVRWALVLVGACLLLGLFTRTACVGGALLLLSFYLAVPPLPGVPENLRVEGYPFVNKNLIELLALLTLATTASGRWVGLDSLIHYLSPWRKRRAAAGLPAERAPGRAPSAPEHVVSPRG
jgi:uncharacterized membrane protein YphA (DoxX/SURF4 family)